MAHKMRRDATDVPKLKYDAYLLFKFCTRNLPPEAAVDTAAAIAPPAAVSGAAAAAGINSGSSTPTNVRFAQREISFLDKFAGKPLPDEARQAIARALHACMRLRNTFAHRELDQASSVLKISWWNH